VSTARGRITGNQEGWFRIASTIDPECGGREPSMSCMSWCLLDSNSLGV